VPESTFKLSQLRRRELLRLRISMSGHIERILQENFGPGDYIRPLALEIETYFFETRFNTETTYTQFLERLKNPNDNQAKIIIWDTAVWLGSKSLPLLKKLGMKLTKDGKKIVLIRSGSAGGRGQFKQRAAAVSQADRRTVSTCGSTSGSTCGSTQGSGSTFQKEEKEERKEKETKKKSNGKQWQQWQ
jgi:hypothetical protein